MELKDFLMVEKGVLVVWDVQEALVNAIFNKEEFLKNLVILINKAREKNMPIFYTKITPLPERFESKTRKMFFRGGFNPGDIVPEIKPHQEDIVLNKNTASIFVGTNFENMLRNASIQTIYFTGIATEIGIESSARHAMNLGFLPVIVEDLVSSGDKAAHERSLTNMKKMMVTIPSKELIKTWEGQ